jgi:hypothetical protein
VPSSHGGSHRFESYSAHHSPIFQVSGFTVSKFNLDLGKAGMRDFSIAGTLIRGNIAESSPCRPLPGGWPAQTEALTKIEKISRQKLGRDRPYQTLGEHGSHEISAGCSNRPEDQKLTGNLE